MNRTRTPSTRPSKSLRPASLAHGHPQPQPLSQTQLDIITIGDYQTTRQDILGKGFCSKVYRATHKETGMQFALKLIEMGQIKSAAQKRFLKNQIKCLHKLKSAQHIVQLKEIVKTKNRLAIVTELCSNSLSQTMKSTTGHKKPLPTEQALPVFQQVVIGYLALRTQGLVHRDIKPANILLDHKGSVKLCDLGFATEDQKINEDRFINVGSPLYMAPEVIKSNTYSSKADIWSLGLVLLQMLIGRLPWSDVQFSKLWEALQKVKFEQLFPPELDVKWKVMLLRCLQFDPRKRCSALELIRYFKPEFEESLFYSQKVSQRELQIEREKGKITVTTANSEAEDFLGKNKVWHESQPNSRLKEGESNIPRGLRMKAKPLTSDKEIVNRFKSYSSKRLRINSNKMNQVDPSHQSKTTKQVEERLVNLKLTGEHRRKNQGAKKEQLATLHLARLTFRVVQLIDSSADNIHCSYLSLSQQLICRLITAILALTRQTGENLRWKGTDWQGKNKECRHVSGVTQQYRENFLQYFELKGHKVKENEDIYAEPLTAILEHSIEKAKEHLKLIHSQVQSWDLLEVDDQQICEFITLFDHLITLKQLFNLKTQSKTLFTNTSRPQQMLKQKTGKALTIEQIRRVVSKAKE